MSAIEELEHLISLCRAEFMQACDDGKTYHEKKEIQQRLRSYVNELDVLHKKNELDKGIH